MRQRIVLATGNAGKLREFSVLLGELGIEFVRQSELGVGEAAETGLTFVENALIKARHAAQVTGLPAMADDSGLLVDTLQGAPGLYSARYAGVEKDDAANNAKLLAELKGVPDTQRTAHYYCCIVYLRHAADPQPVIADGVWEGHILHQPRGTGGFGYDPLFYLPAYGCTAAELPQEEKNRISHRALALRRLYNSLAGRQ